MFILGIETATPWGSIALWEDQETLLEVTLKAAKGGGEFLLATLAEMMPRTGKTLQQLDLVAVGTGPGSYTGIRVGMALAQGLGEGLGIPVAGVNTLRTIAENAAGRTEWIAAVIDARRGEVYSALYQETPDGLVEVMKPASISAGDMAVKLDTLGNTIICGDGSKVYGDIWMKLPHLFVGPRDWDRPKASTVARLALQQQEATPGNAKLSPHGAQSATPAYLKRVEAEIRLEERLNAVNHNPDEAR